jgi:uncharacterized protein GlcG (DUF336 family)
VNSCGDRQYDPGVDVVDYRAKSPAAGRMGKAAELLVAAFYILSTEGELNVSTSIIDDEGVHLVFNRRESTTTLAVQVKARMSSAQTIKDKTFRALVSARTFRPRADLAMLFVVIDIENGAIDTAWLVPSPDYADRVGQPNGKGNYRFVASMKKETRDQWSAYRCAPTDLPNRILRCLPADTP